MPFHLTSQTCVAVGTFNIYIFQPEWVARIERAGANGSGETAEVEVMQNFSQPGIRLSGKDFRCTWEALPDKLILNSEGDQGDCFEIMARVVSALPETPLRAVGANFTWKPAGTFDLNTLPLPEAENDLPPAASIQQRTSHIAVRSDAQVYNLQLSEKSGEVAITVNVHSDVQSTSSEERIDCILQSSRYLDVAERLVSQVFSLEATHGISNL